MPPNTTRSPPAIFQDGKLKPGVYKIQNLYSETYLDVLPHSMGLCCRPKEDLEGGRGLWNIRRFGEGYAIWRVDPGEPYQFCSPMLGLNNGNPVSVTAYPVSWRIERATEQIYANFEYVRPYFGPTDKTWDLWGGCKDNGSLVKFNGSNSNAWQVWKLILVEAESVDASFQLPSEIFGLDLPPYDENEPRQSSAREQHVGSERDDFGTVVTEVTIVTTRKRYRVDA